MDSTVSLFDNRCSPSTIRHTMSQASASSHGKLATGPPHINIEQSSYAPTGILAAKHTFSISPPDDQWYMDSGATSHM
ncbi:hypothetical protein A2U01_0078734, partial [Trifolium medium]|nr:hypothetical protein [Trifolium medium]